MAAKVKSKPKKAKKAKMKIKVKGGKLKANLKQKSPARKGVPEGFSTVTPHLNVRDAARALDFYKRAFGAVETVRMPGPSGKILHAEIKIGDSHVFLADEMPEWGSRSPLTIGGTATALCLYVDDADAVFNQAVAAGAQVKMPLADQFWGDRYGKLADPFGHEWAVATHLEDLTPAEMERRREVAMAQMGQRPQTHPGSPT
jgi:PhnB protein